jgi:hypothetical protein
MLPFEFTFMIFLIEKGAIYLYYISDVGECVQLSDVGTSLQLTLSAFG